jgi:hypothetical protein
MLGSPDSKPLPVSNYGVNPKQLHACRAKLDGFLPLRLNIVTLVESAKIVGNGAQTNESTLSSVADIGIPP